MIKHLSISIFLWMSIPAQAAVIQTTFSGQINYSDSIFEGSVIADWDNGIVHEFHVDVTDSLGRITQ